MARKTLHYNKLGACEICGNCVEHHHPYYFCGCENGNFGDVNFPNQCEDYADVNDEDNDEEMDDFNPNKSVECPECGSDAYWNGTNYECDNCGWCGLP
ncbi:hypothetical protein [Parabacteroides merdae]|jgi:hypothetical protein|uniref:hypothetical protein n=1 Tax=Parabacteroides merdae TaxID=46503 RepID=UPI0034A529BF